MENSLPDDVQKRNLIQKIGPRQSIVDLNQDAVNFKAQFTVQGAKPFEAVVVTQDQLDDPNFNVEYKNVENGVISAQISNIDNVYKSYNILLKSAEEQEVKVNILYQQYTDRLPVKEEVLPPPVPELPQPEEEVPFYKSKTFMWLIIGAAVIGLVYYLYTSNPKDKKSSTPKVKAILDSPVKSPLKELTPPTRENIQILKSPPKKSPSPKKLTLLEKLQQVQLE